MDWVPAHFPRTAHGLAPRRRHLYEHADPQRGEHPTGHADLHYGRKRGANYLLGVARHWQAHVICVALPGSTADIGFQLSSRR